VVFHFYFFNYYLGGFVLEAVINGQIVEGVFIKRLNRFVAEVEINNEVKYVHVANTGRMKELLVSGTKVLLRKANKAERKTDYDLLMVYKGSNLVLIDSTMPNILLERAFKSGGLRGFSSKYPHVKREYTYGNSRFDLAVSNERETILIEAKCVTLVKENKVAAFPDAPTIRGRKHLYELIEAKEKGLRAAVFFIVQRNDAIKFTPNYETDRGFAEAVKEASKRGVEFYAYTCDVTPKMIKINKEIPIILP